MKIASKCRVCGSDELESVMSLGEQHLTGVFPKSIDEAITCGPVDLIRCSDSMGCGLVQLKQSYDLSEMYGLNYGYRSGLNQSMVQHLAAKVQKILDLDILKDGDIVIDIGSNDATTLKAYPRSKFELVGIDPTGIKFAEYYPPEIKLVPDFFSAEVVAMATEGKKAKVITSFSMFYDLEDPIGFAKEIEAALDSEGIWIFEQSYLPSMLRTNSFDTICHEHLEFYALKQINWIAKNAGLKVIDVEFNDINGGSFSITAAKAQSRFVPNQEKLNQILQDEDSLGLNDGSAFIAFRKRVEVERKKLMQFLLDAKSQGKRVVGLGASTKGNVLLQYYGIDKDLVAEIGEVNREKYGAFTPGTKIPLMPEDDVLNGIPDYVLILPWHFKNFFLSLEKLKGRNLVFPLPNFQIIKP